MLTGSKYLQTIFKIVDSARYSWLEATPTKHYQQWERHLAAICKHFEPVGNTGPWTLDKFLR
jgi:hypothetical protein